MYDSYHLSAVSSTNLASLTKDDGLDAMNQQINQLIEKEKYQEAIPIAERAVAVAKRVWGSEQPETVHTLDNLGFLFQKIGTTPEPSHSTGAACAQHGANVYRLPVGTAPARS